MNHIKPGFCAMLCKKYTKATIQDYLMEVKYKQRDDLDDIERGSSIVGNKFGPRNLRSRNSPQKMNILKPQKTKKLVRDTRERLEREEDGIATIDPDTLAEEQAKAKDLERINTTGIREFKRMTFVEKSDNGNHIFRNLRGQQLGLESLKLRDDQALMAEIEQKELDMKNAKRLRVVHKNKLVLDRPILIPSNMTEKQINEMINQ